MLRLVPIVSESQSFINHIAISYTDTLVPYKYSLQLWNLASQINIRHITTESKRSIKIPSLQFALILIQGHCTEFCEVDKRGNSRKLYSNIYPTSCKRYTVYFIWKTALHVSGGTSTHHQERIQLSTACGICHTVTTTCRYRGRAGTAFQLFYGSGRQQ